MSRALLGYVRAGKSEKCTPGNSNKFSSIFERISKSTCRLTIDGLNRENPFFKSLTLAFNSFSSRLTIFENKLKLNWFDTSKGTTDKS